MKKRIVSLFLLAGFLLTMLMFSACEKADTLVTEAIENTQSLDSYEAVLKLQMDVEAQDVTVSVPMTLDIKASDVGGENPVVFANMYTSFSGETSKETYYTEGDWVYFVTENGGYKLSAEEAAGEYDCIGDVKALLRQIPEELLQDVELVKEEDGSKSVSLELSDEDLSEIYKDLIDSLNEDAGFEDVSDLSFSEATVSVCVSDGYVSVYELTFTMNATVQSVETVSKIEMSVEFKNPGEDVTVTPPEGYEDFKEEIDAFELISEAVRNTVALDDLDLTVDSDVDMVVEDLNIDMAVDYVIKVKDQTSSSPVMYFNSVIAQSGESTETSLYLDQEWVYVSSDGEGYKMATDDSGVTVDDYIEIVSMRVKELPATDLETAEIIENPDGSVTVKVVPTLDSFVDVFEDYLTFEIGVDPAEVDFESCNVSVTVANGYVISYTVSFSGSAQSEGMTIDIDDACTTTFKNPGGDISVTLPSGFENFEELTY